MNIQAKKYQLIEWITNIQDTRLIDRLAKFADESDWWDELSETEKASIERGLKDLEEGRYVDHSEVKKLYEIIDYLDLKWTERELKRFTHKLEKQIVSVFDNRKNPKKLKT